MADRDPITIETTREAAECVSTRFGAREMRKLASNAGVSRERGDTKIETAVKLAEQYPTIAAQALDNDPEVAHDTGPFREEREAWGQSEISLDEAVRRAKHDRMRRRLERLRDAMPVCYEAEVLWEYTAGGGGAWTMIHVRPEPGWDINPLLKERFSICLTPRGAPRMLEDGDADLLSSKDSPNRAWSATLRRIGAAYCP